MNKEQSFLSVVFFSCSLHLHVRYARSTYFFFTMGGAEEYDRSDDGKGGGGGPMFPTNKTKVFAIRELPPKSLAKHRHFFQFKNVGNVPKLKNRRIFRLNTATTVTERRGRQKKSFAEYRHNHYIDPGWFPPPRFSRLCGLSSRHHRPGPQYAHAWAARQKEGGWAVWGGNVKIAE